MIREIILRMRKECRKEERRIQITQVVKTREEEDWNREKVKIVWTYSLYGENYYHLMMERIDYLIGRKSMLRITANMENILVESLTGTNGKRQNGREIRIEG